jgi:hypothetical protein
MMIKPEDISDELSRELFRHASGITMDACRINVAAIANALIEAGVVSPPCWEVVGETLNTVTVFKRQEDAARWVEVDNGFRKSEMRHWKGQAE